MNDSSDVIKCLDSKDLPSSYPEKDVLRNKPEEEKIAILNKDAKRIRMLNKQRAAYEQLDAERIAAGEPEPDPDEYIEVLARQRRWFESQRELAKQRVMQRGAMPGRDFETQVEMDYLNFASVAFSSANVFFHSSHGNRAPATMDDLVKRCKDAENSNSSKDKLIDSLRDEIYELQHKLGQAKGRSRNG